MLLLLLLLSHFSRVWLRATPQTAVHQAPLSLEFSRQEHWSGLPLPSPMHESEKWKWSRSVVPDSSRPQGLQPTRLLHPWEIPGKSTGAGCHCLLREDIYRVIYIYIYAQMIYKKVAKTIHWSIIAFLSSGTGTIVYPYANNELWSIPSTIMQRIYFKMDCKYKI